MSDEFAMPAGASTSNKGDSASLSGPPTGDDASAAASALMSAQAPHSTTSAAEGVAVTSLLPSQPPRAQSRARAIIKAPASPVQALTRRPTPPIPIPKKSGAHVHKLSRSGRSQSTDSLEGSSPRMSAFLLGLSANDVMSSSDRDTDRDAHSEDEEDRLPISRRQLDSSPDESDGEGSVSAWVSSLISKTKGLSELPLRAWPATAPRPRARAIGGQLAAARAQTPAPALPPLHSKSTASFGRVRPAAALTAVATAAPLSALQPTFKATAASTAVAPSASLTAAAPAVSAGALAKALAAALCAAAPADALSAGRPTATAAPSPAQPESAQALQADDGQLADAVEVVAAGGAEGMMPIQAAEADAAQLSAVAPADAPRAVGSASVVALSAGCPKATAAMSMAQPESAEADAVQPVQVHIAEASVDDLAADAANVMAHGDAAEADAAQPANADATEAVLSAASDALTISMDLAHQANSAPLHRVIVSVEQFVPSEGQKLRTGSDLSSAVPTENLHSGSPVALGGESTHPIAAAHQLADAQSAAPEEGVHSAGLLAIDRDSLQPAAAAEQDADVQTANPQRSLSSNEGEESCEEDRDADDDYLSSFSWEASPFTTTASSPEPAAVAASNEAAAFETQEDVTGSGPSAEPMQPAMESASQLDGMMFGIITARNLPGAEGGQHVGSLGAASPTAPAAAPAAIGASDSAAAGSTAVAASDAGGVSTHTAVVSLGKDEDRSSAAAAAGTAEGNVPVSQPTDNQTAVSHDVEEDCKKDDEEEAQVNTSLGYSAFVTDMLLGRMEQKASSNGGDITALGKRTACAAL